jgi:23S rRNA pseudouridine1911/1915/1917 synthase
MQNKAVTICMLGGKERADKLIASLFSDLSRNRIQMLVDQQMIKINGQAIANASEKLKNKDLVEIQIPDVVQTPIKATEGIPLDIVYEDDDMLVINKQAGLTVHPGAGSHDDTMVNALLATVENLSGINGVQRPGIVHRLDRDTTGLMLVAKNDTAHKSLAEGIQTREVTRIYHALVWNSPSLPAGKIEANIGRHPRERTKMAALKKSGKEAITHYRLVKSYFGGVLSLVECKLETGRTHQIRVHMEHKGWPLVGDNAYVGTPHIKKTGSLPEDVRKAVESFKRQALHAKFISFTHPTTFEFMEFESEYPDDMAELLSIIENAK